MTLNLMLISMSHRFCWRLPSALTKTGTEEWCRSLTWRRPDMCSRRWVLLPVAWWFLSSTWDRGNWLCPPPYEFTRSERHSENCWDGRAFCARYRTGSCWPRRMLFQIPFGQSSKRPERSQPPRLGRSPAHSIHSVCVGHDPTTKPS